MALNRPYEIDEDARLEALREEAAVRERETRQFGGYLRRTAADLARTLGPMDTSLGMARIEIERVLWNVAREVRRVTPHFDALHVEFPLDGDRE